MAAAGTVAVLLPTAYFTLRQTTPPPVELLRGAGVALAVATDSNPGTSPCTSLLLAQHELHSVRTDAGGSARRRHAPAARALGLDELGTIEVGKRADFAFWRIERPAELCYGLGANPLAAVMYRGKIRTAAAA